MDFNFTIANYKPHPVQKNYTVFHFFKEEESDYFKQELNTNNIPFEFSSEKEEHQTVYYFGVKNQNIDAIKKINFVTKGKHRKRTISNPIVAYSVLLITSLLLLAAILGAMKTYLYS